MKSKKKEAHEKNITEKQSKPSAPPMPSNVIIDTANYKIIIKDKTYINGRECYGHIDYAKSEIEISTCEISESNQKITVAHEVVHGLTVERGIKELIPEQHYEKIVNELAKGFIQLVRDNPKFINYIQ